MPWARASLKLSGHRVVVAVFEQIIDRLGNPTGKVTINTSGEARVWSDECPLPSHAPAGDQFAWAVSEAETVFERARADLAECDLELWLGIAVGAQLGLLCDSALLGRLALLGVDLVLDLYGWD